MIDMCPNCNAPEDCIMTLKVHMKDGSKKKHCMQCHFHFIVHPPPPVANTR